MEFYRIYYINAKGETAGFSNFMALNDTLACEHAVTVMTKSEWPGAEVWENRRRVHCVGLERSVMGPLQSRPSLTH